MSIPKKPAVRSQQERDRLVLDNQNLPRYMARQLYDRYASVRLLGLEDATQIGFIRLLRAAELWEEERGIKFSTYACSAMQRAICSEALTQQRKASGLSNAVKLDWGDWDLPAREMPDEVLGQETLEVWKLLPKRLRFVVWKYAVDKWTYKQISQRLRISKERVRQLYREALSWLERKLEGRRPPRLRDCVTYEKRGVA